MGLDEATKSGDQVMATLSHAGYDKMLGTSDDLQMYFRTGSGLSIEIPSEDKIGEALDIIEKWSVENKNRFPPAEDETMGDLRDQISIALLYRRQKRRISSDGPDGKPKTMGLAFNWS